MATMTRGQELIKEKPIVDVAQAQSPTTAYNPGGASIAAGDSDWLSSLKNKIVNAITDHASAAPSAGIQDPSKLKTKEEQDYYGTKKSSTNTSTTKDTGAGKKEEPKGDWLSGISNALGATTNAVGNVIGGAKDAFDKMTPEQKMMLLMAAGRIAAGSQGQQNVSDFNTFAGGMGEQYVKNKEAKQKQENEIAQINTKGAWDKKIAEDKAAAKPVNEITPDDKAKISNFMSVVNPSGTAFLDKSQLMTNVSEAERNANKAFFDKATQEDMLNYLANKRGIGDSWSKVAPGLSGSSGKKTSGQGSILSNTTDGANAADRVVVIDPQGGRHTVPSAQLKQALAQGYKQG